MEMLIKIPDISRWVIATLLNPKISEVENRIPDHTKYITAKEFNKLTAYALHNDSKQ